MAAKVPIRAVFDGSTATGLAEFQSTEFIALAYGGLGASLSLGSAGQALKVNDAGNAVEFGAITAANPASADGDSLGTASTFPNSNALAPELTLRTCPAVPILNDAPRPP